MKSKILIIEDDPDQRLIEKTQLQAAGYETMESDNAKDGIALAVSARPNLIIMDVRLPYKKKGIGAAKILHKTQQTRHIPIIFVTAYSSLEESREIRNIENSVYLLKPYDPTTLIRHIENLLHPADAA